MSRIRPEVLHLAEKLSRESGLETMALYDWLMDIGKSRSKNPRLLSFRAGRGRVWLEGHYYTDYLERFQPCREENTDLTAADYWEGQILARQERWSLE